MREETGPEPGQDGPSQDPRGQEPPGQELPGQEPRGQELPGQELPGQEPGRELPGEEARDRAAAPDAREAPGAGPARPVVVLPPETGDMRVDEALSLLEDLTELPVAEHPALFEQVHAQLSQVLGELGSSGPGAATRRDGS